MRQSEMKRAISRECLRLCRIVQESEIFRGQELYLPGMADLREMLQEVMRKHRWQMLRKLMKRQMKL